MQGLFLYDNPDAMIVSGFCHTVLHGHSIMCISARFLKYKDNGKCKWRDRKQGQDYGADGYVVGNCGCVDVI